MDPDLMADYARGDTPEPDYKPSISFSIEGDGFKFSRKNCGLNAEKGTNYYEKLDDPFKEIVWDTWVKNRILSFSVHIYSKEGERKDIAHFQNVKKGEKRSEEVDVVFGEKTYHFVVSLKFTVIEKE